MRRSMPLDEMPASEGLTAKGYLLTPLPAAGAARRRFWSVTLASTIGVKRERKQKG